MGLWQREPGKADRLCLSVASSGALSCVPACGDVERELAFVKSGHKSKADPVRVHVASSSDAQRLRRSRSGEGAHAGRCEEELAEEGVDEARLCLARYLGTAEAV